jgi:hypothetical protein
MAATQPLLLISYGKSGHAALCSMSVYLGM